MAIFHCQVKPISRGAGRSAVASSAYRSAEIVVDQQTGQTYDYTKKSRVLETAILTPDNHPISRQDLWNLAAQSEKRIDSREAREFELALPHELPRAESIALANKFAKMLVDNFQVAADVCIHKSGAGDDKNIHAHVMITTRRFEAGHLHEKTRLEQEDKKLKEQGLPTGKQQITLIRKKWAEICNEKLQEHGINQISHLSLKDQKIERLPQIHLGQHAAAMERRGILTDKGNRNRSILEESGLTQAEQTELANLKYIQAGVEKARADKEQYIKEKPMRQLKKIQEQIAARVPAPAPQPVPQPVEQQPQPEPEPVQPARQEQTEYKPAPFEMQLAELVQEKPKMDLSKIREQQAKWKEQRDKARREKLKAQQQEQQKRHSHSHGQSR